MSGPLLVATTRNVGEKVATFGDVGDMSATRWRHAELSDLVCDNVDGRGETVSIVNVTSFLYVLD